MFEDIGFQNEPSRFYIGDFRSSALYMFLRYIHYDDESNQLYRLAWFEIVADFNALRGAIPNVTSKQL